MQVAPGVWLDARRAVFLAETSTLAVADLHLGYAWAHRAGGNLLPLSAADDSTERLVDLVDDYAPRELVLLGDIVHASIAIEPLITELRRLHETLSPRVTLRFLAGNHDRHLASLLRTAALEIPLLREHVASPHRLLHGDETNEKLAAEGLSVIRGQNGKLFLGHEHPSITLSGGPGSTARCPCFLVGNDVIVLPAFSPWAAGSNIRGAQFMSAYARQTEFHRAVAIVAGKLLPVPLP